MSGEITEIKTNYFFLDNGADEIKVYLKKSALIDKTRLKEGQTVSVVGVLEQGTNEIQLWPRANEDVEAASATMTESEVDKKISAEVSKAKAEKYIAVFLGVTSILLIGLMGSQKGAMIIRAAKDYILKRFGRK
jgi:DNA/RNA endonuclease YhcR with UshA esterase domain